MKAHPFLANDYPIQWSTMTADHVEPDLKKGIELAEERLAELRALTPDQVTYENTFLALEKATEELGRAWGRINHLDGVTKDDELNTGLNKMLPEVSSFFSAITLDQEIWSSLKAFRDSAAAEQLNSVEKRFVTETCTDFVSSGADLPEDKRARVAEIDAELSAITQTYQENVVKSTDDWELILDDSSRLDGLPDMAVEGARQDALAKDHGTEDEPKYRFTLQYPSMGPVMQLGEDDSLRKEIWLAGCEVGRTGEWDNTDNVWKILALRQEKSELLGKKNFADMVLEHRMAKTGLAALDFSENLHSKIETAFKKDSQELADYVAKKENLDQPRLLEPWEVGYWAEKRRQEEYDFDEELLRPYFSVENVMSGMFSIMSTLFGIQFEEQASVHGKAEEGKAQTWHPECKYYNVTDTDSKELLGSFYADWHPRQGKREGAWMNTLHTGLPPKDGTPREQNIGLMVGNMTKPVGDTPALLNHREVETVFHEFGHLLHHMLSDVEIKSLTGMSVPWDFVELPSQILENYCWDRQSLDLFAKHYETGEAIPEDLFQKMIAARNYMSGTDFMRQLAMGKLDLEIHINLDKYKGLSLDELDRTILADYRTKLATESPSILRKFGHLFSSPVAYASGYYSYKWAEVLDADAFTRFKKEGILNEETGRSFRKEILGAGNSRPADESYRAFMGRDPELEPLLERAGLA